MNVSPSYIISYLEQKFKGKSKLSGNSREFMVPSIFLENDVKRHMSINLDSGLWRCFKTGETGNFPKLYSILEGVSYKQAEIKIVVGSFSYGDYKIKPTVKKFTSDIEKTLDSSSWVALNQAVSWCKDYSTSLPIYYEKILDFIINRGVVDYALSNGWYFNSNTKRLVIPFHKDGKLIYYQERALFPDQFPKYLNPPSELVKSSNILYPFDWDCHYVVVCEGPLDAISLQIMGINATSIQGSFCSRVQMEQLREFSGDIIMSFDNDIAGWGGMCKMNSLRKKLMMPLFQSTRVPDPYKDWNEYLCKEEDYLEVEYFLDSPVFDDYLIMANQLGMNTKA